MTLLTGYQTPQAIRRAGQSRLRTWLVKRKVRSADQIATDALAAAKAQHTVVPASGTSKRSSLWPGDASTSCGPCSARTGPSN
ncbi:hypothetical protein BJ993_004931 [Nocardioides aromaticivorans]|uniref:Uncharacterized protein n=2 Tax=Actinomycetes TaxID=1760 RepID=A0A7Y9ZPM3_9ACTN|nr:hypothetical protein [Nocardioides aromaticivorans]BAJ39930.1 hypothetical protein [Terrabacter sp. DBF63]